MRFDHPRIGLENRGHVMDTILIAKPGQTLTSDLVICEETILIANDHFWGPNYMIRHCVHQPGLDILKDMEPPFAVFQCQVTNVPIALGAPPIRLLYLSWKAKRP